MERRMGNGQSEDKTNLVLNHVDGSNEVENLPETLPLLTLRDVVLFPNMVIPILIVRDVSVAALQQALVHDRYIFLVLQKDPENDQPAEDDIYKIGVIGRALQVLKLPNGTAKVLIEGLARARLVSMEKLEDYFRVTVKLQPKLFTVTPRLKALSRTVLDSFTRYVKLSKMIPDEVLMNIPTSDEPERVADILAAHSIMNLRRKQEILETRTVEDQLTMLAAILSEEIEILELERSIDKEVKERLHKSQKDYYLHEQMRVIKEELGEDDEEGEIKELEKKIKKSGMSPEASKKTLEELNKLRRMHIMSPEYTVVRNYLDWLISFS